MRAPAQVLYRFSTNGFAAICTVQRSKFKACPELVERVQRLRSQDWTRTALSEIL